MCKTILGPSLLQLSSIVSWASSSFPHTKPYPRSWDKCQTIQRYILMTVFSLLVSKSYQGCKTNCCLAHSLVTDLKSMCQTPLSKPDIQIWIALNSYVFFYGSSLAQAYKFEIFLSELNTAWGSQVDVCITYLNRNPKEKFFCNCSSSHHKWKLRTQHFQIRDSQCAYMCIWTAELCPCIWDHTTTSHETKT